MKGVFLLDIQNIRVLAKVDSKANWESNNPVLQNKEIGYERESGKYKIGCYKNERLQTWNELSYPDFFLNPTEGGGGSEGGNANGGGYIIEINGTQADKTFIDICAAYQEKTRTLMSFLQGEFSLCWIKSRIISDATV